MSMISSQCDRLRDRATRVEIFLEGCTDTIPMDTHEQLRSAADTIWELRNKLADMVDQREEVERLKSENAKLRELVLRAHGCKINEGCCEDCWDEYGDCPIEADMRVLGIEESNE